MYSNTGLRAGLVLFTLTLIISLVSAVPIPIAITGSQSSSSPTLSSPSSRDGHVLLIHGIQPSPISMVSPTVIPRNLDEDNFPLERRSKVGDFFKRIGQGIKHAAQKVGGFFKRVGQGIKYAAQKVGQGIKYAAQKVGQGIKYAAQKVGNFVKTTGAKIVKVVTKAWSVVDEAAGKIISKIPGIGIVGKGLELMGKGLSAASDKIHATLSGGMAKAVNGFDKAKKVLGYVP